ncbi:hypothetical protein IU505_34450, partial [Nocardia nova]|nr:hypothetical protein [Nocardia nova]
TVVSPCRDEAGALPGVLSAIPAGYRVIVVDNGSTDDTAAAVDLLLRGRTAVMDLGQITAPGAAPMWFATVAGTGFDARVTLRANRMRWPRGPLRYTVAALAEITGGIGLPYRIELSGIAPGALDNPAADGAFDTDAVMVAVGNTRTYGGGMLICPDAES